jgi:hypothetical protein
MNGNDCVVTAVRNAQAVSSAPPNLHADYAQGLEAFRNLQHDGQSHYAPRRLFGHRGGQRQGPLHYTPRVNSATESYNTDAGHDFTSVVPDPDPSHQYLHNAPPTGPVFDSYNMASMPRMIDGACLIAVCSILSSR